MIARLSAALLIAVALLGACGGGGRDERDRVAQAVRDGTRAVHDRDVRTWCFKAFASTDLPPRLARQLGVPEGRPGTPTAWDRHYRECVRGHSKPGAFNGARPRITVGRVTLGSAVTGADGISRTATAAVDGREQDGKGRSFRYTFKLVDFRGDWKVIFEVN